MVDKEKYLVVEMTSSSIRLALGYVQDSKVQLIDILERKCLAIDEGEINDQVTLSNTLIEMKKELENKHKITLKNVTLILHPLGLFFHDERDSFTVSNTVIERVDVRNVHNVLRKKIKLSYGLKLIDDVVKEYILDENINMKSLPLGNKALMLGEVTTIYALPETLLKSYEDIMFKARLTVVNRITTPLASAFYLNSNKGMDAEYLLLNVGGSITTLTHIKNKVEIIDNDNIRFGSSYINEDLIENLSLNEEECELFKDLYGFDENPEFNFYIKDKITISLLANEIEKSLNENLNSLIAKIKQVITNTPLKVYLIGGGLKIKGIEKYFAKQGIDIIIPYVKTIMARDIRYVSLLGAISYASYKDNFYKAMHNETSYTEIGIKRE